MTKIPSSAVDSLVEKFFHKEVDLSMTETIQILTEFVKKEKAATACKGIYHLGAAFSVKLDVIDGRCVCMRLSYEVAPVIITILRGGWSSQRGIREDIQRQFETVAYYQSEEFKEDRKVVEEQDRRDELEEYERQKALQDDLKD